MENNQNNANEFEFHQTNPQATPEKLQYVNQPPAQKSNFSIARQWWFWMILGIFSFLFTISLAIIGNSDEYPSASEDQDSSFLDISSTENDLGNYEVDILSCRMAEDYEGNPVVIVKYKFTNNDDDPAKFVFSVDTDVYQDGVGLLTAYLLDDSANYSNDNQYKEIQTGASIEVEVAYDLHNTTSPINVEVTESLSYSDKKISKTFNIR